MLLVSHTASPGYLMRGGPSTADATGEPASTALTSVHHPSCLTLLRGPCSTCLCPTLCAASYGSHSTPTLWPPPPPPLMPPSQSPPPHPRPRLRPPPPAPPSSNSTGVVSSSPPPSSGSETNNLTIMLCATIVPIVLVLLLVVLLTGFLYRGRGAKAPDNYWWFSLDKGCDNTLLVTDIQVGGWVGGWGSQVWVCGCGWGGVCVGEQHPPRHGYSGGGVGGGGGGSQVWVCGCGWGGVWGGSNTLLVTDIQSEGEGISHACVWVFVWGGEGGSNILLVTCMQG